MTNCIHFRKSFAIIFMCCLMMITVRAAIGETVRIVIFPFNIHSSQDLDFLQSGLYEMLSNRLGSEDGTITVVPREKVAEQVLIAPAGSLHEKSTISQTLQADYFVFGSLTAIGASISTDVQFYSINQTAPLVKLSQTGSQDDVIAHIDEFTAMVNQRVFEIGTELSALSDGEEPGAETDPSIKGLSMVAIESRANDRWQSDTFKTQFKGVAVDDIDGDDANEIVLIDKNRVYVYRHVNRSFEKITQVEHGRNALFLGVDAADINANGRAEVFITSYGKINERPESFIYEHKDGGLLQIADRTRWYYRVLQDPNGRPMLIAQKKMDNRTFVEKFHILDLKNGNYVSVEAITPPKMCTLYDMVLTRNSRNGGRLFVGYDRYSEITAWTDDGQMLWESGEPFGGSLNYIEYTNRQAHETVRKYIAKRILLTDTDGNGEQEVIAIRNINSSPEWMTKARRYKHGYIACLEWDASGALQTKWKTEKERGYISDVAVADATNDGKADLVFTVVSDEKADIKKSSSYLVIQQLP